MLPRDCDGGLATRCKVCGAECESDPPRCVRCATVQHGSASGVNLDERWTTTDAETDNAARIARDLETIKGRLFSAVADDERKKTAWIEAYCAVVAAIDHLEKL